MAPYSGRSARKSFNSNFLRIAREGHATLAVEADALLQRGVVERTTAPQDRLKLTLLDGRWLELLLIRLAARRYRLLAHGCRLVSRPECSPVLTRPEGALPSGRRRCRWQPRSAL